MGTVCILYVLSRLQKPRTTAREEVTSTKRMVQPFSPARAPADLHQLTEGKLLLTVFTLEVKSFIAI